MLVDSRLYTSIRERPRNMYILISQSGYSIFDLMKLKDINLELLNFMRCQMFKEIQFTKYMLFLLHIKYADWFIKRNLVRIPKYNYII